MVSSGTESSRSNHQVSCSTKYEGTPNNLLCTYKENSETDILLYFNAFIVIDIDISTNQTLSQDDMLLLARENAATCGICLEDLPVKCAYSSNTDCKHLYHEDCIVTWLSTRRDLRCPICRQIFICTPIRSLETSLTSQRELSSDYQNEDSENDPIDVETPNSESTTNA